MSTIVSPGTLAPLEIPSKPLEKVMAAFAAQIRKEIKTQPRNINVLFTFWNAK